MESALRLDRSALPRRCHEVSPRRNPFVRLTSRPVTTGRRTPWPSASTSPSAADGSRRRVTVLPVHRKRLRTQARRCGIRGAHGGPLPQPQSRDLGPLVGDTQRAVGSDRAHCPGCGDSGETCDHRMSWLDEVSIDQVLDGVRGGAARRPGQTRAVAVTARRSLVPTSGGLEPCRPLQVEGILAVDGHRPKPVGTLRSVPPVFNQ